MFPFSFLLDRNKTPSLRKRSNCFLLCYAERTCLAVWLHLVLDVLSPNLFGVLRLPGLPHPRMTVRNFDRKLAIVFGLSFQCGNFPRPCQPEVNRVSRDSVPRPLEKKNVFFSGGARFRSSGVSAWIRASHRLRPALGKPVTRRGPTLRSLEQISSVPGGWNGFCRISGYASTERSK